MIEIEFMFWKECPSHREAWKRLKAVLEKTRLKARIRRIEVRTEEEAGQRSFYGSPTIRVDGADIDPEGVEGQRTGLSCRIYRNADGRVTPLPSPERILEALQKANRGGGSHGVRSR